MTDLIISESILFNLSKKYIYLRRYWSWQGTFIGLILLLPEILYQKNPPPPPLFNQKWYADDTRVGGNFGQLIAHLKDLQVRGPLWGYFPDPTKRFLVVALWNVARAEDFFQGTWMTVVNRSRYPGGFFGDREADATWIGEKCQGCHLSTCSPLTLDCRSEPNRSGHSCSGSP